MSLDVDELVGRVFRYPNTDTIFLVSGSTLWDWSHRHSRRVDLIVLDCSGGTLATMTTTWTTTDWIDRYVRPCDWIV